MTSFFSKFDTTQIGPERDLPYQKFSQDHESMLIVALQAVKTEKITFFDDILKLLESLQKNIRKCFQDQESLLLYPSISVT